MADDDISIVSFERQASTQSVGRLSIDFRRWQSHHEADEDNRKLFSLIEWTKRRRELTRHDQGNDIYIDGVCVLVLKDLLRKTPQPEFDEFDNGRTVLHLAILHRMPVHFILLLVQHMKQAALDCEDNAKCRAIDYLLDWEEDSVSNEILEKLIPKINLSEERDCPMSKNPLIRLCQRPLGGCQLPESLKTSQEFKNKMLEEAVIMGSCSTVKYLLSTGADAESVPYLLHVATTSNHDSLDKIIFLIHHGKLDASQLNEEGQTLVHVAANGKPPMVELLNRALEEGVDPNIRDLYGDTALHKVTKNHGERTISWKESEQAMETLLGHKGLELNVPNSCGLKPLAILMRAKSTLDADLFWKWVQTGADFTDDGYERDLKKRGPQCPLATMCCRPDGHVLIDELLQHLAADKLQDYLKYMLEAAVEKGKAETVRILLDKGANAKEDKGRLLMVAARSKIQVRKKLGYLKNAGADPQYKDSKGFSVLHEVARSDTATEKILKYCTDILQLSTDTKDEYGRMPLHIAAMSNHACSEMLLEKLLDKLPPNATCPHSLFQLVLQNSSNKELRRRKIMLLLEKGYQPTMKDFDDYKGDAEDFQDLFLSTEVFTSSQEPFQFLLFLATYCKGKLESARTKSAKSSCQSDFTKKRQWRKVNAYVEAAAIMLIEELAKDRTFIGCELENAYLQDAYKMGWNEFLANKNVGKILGQKFYGQRREEKSNKGEETWRALDPRSWTILYRLPGLVCLFLLQCLLLPIILLIMRCCYRNGFGRNIRRLYIHPRRLPVVTFCSSMVSYIGFLALLIARIVWTEDSPQKNISWFEWVLLLYVLAMLAEEFYQALKHKIRYLTITNGCDCFMILCFATYLILRAVASSTDDLKVLRVSEAIFAVAVALSFLRLLYYMQVNYKLGPILFSFKAIWAEVVSFMAILGVVLVAFGTAVAVVYNGGVYADDFQYVPPEVRGLWPSLQTMYWSLYGQIGYNTLDDGGDVIRPERTFALILFALWSLVSVIVLLNMLIALINEAFDRVKKLNADLVWNLAVNDIITDIEESPSFPLPMNLFCIIASVFKLDDLVGDDTTNSANPPSRKDPFKVSLKKDKTDGKMSQNSDKSKEERTAHSLETVVKLERQIKNLKARLSKGINTLRYQTKQRFLKHAKRVRVWLRRLDSHKGDEDCQDGQERNENSEDVLNDSDSDSDTSDDSDMDEDQQMRCERVQCEESSGPVGISYTGSNGKVGCCQFLNKPMSSKFNYFEVKIVDYGRDGSIAIGIAHHSYPLNKMPGLRKGSIAFHCGSSQLIYKNRKRANVSCSIQQGDVIGCGIQSSFASMDVPIVFFTRNNKKLGSMKVTLSRLFPIIGLRSQGGKVEVNWTVRWNPRSNEIGRLRTSSVTSIEADCITEDYPGVKRDRAASWMSVKSQTPRQRKSNLIETIGATDNNLFKLKAQSDSKNSRGVGGIQSLLQPMSPEFSYYEVTMKSFGTSAGGAIAVGLARRDYPLDELPGWEKGSVGWHSDDGGIYIENKKAQQCSQGRVGDIIGCGIDFAAREKKSPDWELDISEREERDSNIAEVFFTRNGKLMVKETIEEPLGGLFPIVGMQRPDGIVEINWSAVPPTVRAERVCTDRENNFQVVSFVDNPYGDVGGIQLTLDNMDELRYFEVTIISTGEQSAIGIGVASLNYPLGCQPGWRNESIAYHCKDGGLYCNGDRHPEGSLCSSEAKDIIGCGIRSLNDQLHVFFTHNGEDIHQEALRILQPTDLYPTVCMHSAGEKVKINLNAHWENGPQKCPFSRRKRIEIIGSRAFYEPNGDTEVGTVQLSREIGKEYPYFEVKVTGVGKDGYLGIGLAPNDYPLDLQPGLVPGSVGYHFDDGCLFEGISWKRKAVRNPVIKDDRLGCGIGNPEKKGDIVRVFFTHNGEVVCETELKRPSKGGLFPTIGMRSKGAEITVIKDAKWPRSSLEMQEL